MRRRLFTWYCWVHREHVILAPPPSEGVPRPCCPVCEDSLYYVPNGSTEVPTIKLSKPNPNKARRTRDF